jgi:predicted alpha/beta hydrolase
VPELSVTAPDKHCFNLRLFECEFPARAVFVIAPAMGVSASYYDGFATALAQKGFHVAVTELRGQGSSSLRASRDVDWGYATMVERDFPALTAAVQKHWPALPLYFLGHSQGGHLALLFLAHQPENIAGVLTIASGSTWFRGWPFPQNLKILLQTQAVRLPLLQYGYYDGRRFGFAGRQARTEMCDWANAALNGKFNLRDAGLDYEAGMKKSVLPVHLFSLQGDVLAPFGATAVLAEKFPKARHIHLGPTDLSKEARDHFRWTRHPDAVIPHLLAALSL